MHSGAHLAIVGGGTAGWLAAHLIRHAACKAGAANSGLRISVIESPDIPTVGVGEGTTAIFRQVLLDLGLDEFEFIKETQATIKYGILHKDWRAKGQSYWAPIDDLQQMVPAPAGASSTDISSE